MTRLTIWRKRLITVGLILVVITIPGACAELMSNPNEPPELYSLLAVLSVGLLITLLALHPFSPTKLMEVNLAWRYSALYRLIWILLVAIIIFATLWRFVEWPWLYYSSLCMVLAALLLVITATALQYRRKKELAAGTPLQEMHDDLASIEYSETDMEDLLK